MRAEFARAAATYDAAAVIAGEVGRRMAERLDYVRIAPRRMADVGCATGDGIRALMRRYPKAVPYAIDFALPMLQATRDRETWLARMAGRGVRAINADVAALPLANASLGLVWSNLMLHWLVDLRPALNELHRVLEVGGLVNFSMLGPDTLKELRQACIECGVNPPLRGFADMHDVGDLLVAAGFADPVMDMEMLTLTYQNPRQLLRDQRHLGVRDALLGALPWRQWRRVLRAWEAQRSEGRLAASFEIIYGHAWKPAPKTTADGRSIIKFEKR